MSDGMSEEYRRKHMESRKLEQLRLNIIEGVIDDYKPILAKEILEKLNGIQK